VRGSEVASALVAGALAVNASLAAPQLWVLYACVALMAAFTAIRRPPLDALVPRLQFMLDQLNVHHQIEDLHYFPIFRAADDRLARGFDVLEGDHHHIHADMARTAGTANALLRSLQGGGDTMRRCGDDYADASAALLKGLARHLDDEEDLIVPLILDRSEAALGVAHHGG
jgi:hemerythrin-like domain-containing protein